MSYFKVLRRISSTLQDKPVNWVVTGSCSFALQGVPVIPNDIDLQADLPGALAIEQYLSKYVVRKVKFSTTEKIRSHFGELCIYGIKVEIMGDVQKRLADGTWEKPVDLEQYKRFVEFRGMMIPVLALEYEYEAYMKLGRFEKAEILRETIANKEAL
ncbi:MAG TPA: hypothetical protein VFA09_11390 [Ktedonobacteraceae bacterium]|nr:hypothetical protein [Ktedonobacteraceae bacterium]